MRNILLLFLPGAFIFLYQCQQSVVCHAPIGNWSGDGQELVFLTDQKGYWITQFGSQRDTESFVFDLDCDHKPPRLDLKDFQSGTNLGKTLFGIIDWQSDTSFRLQYETGTSSEVRPHEFDNEQIQQFIKK